MFSLHKLIAYMLPNILLLFEELVNFEKDFTSIFLRNKVSIHLITQHIYTFSLYYYTKMITNLSNVT